MANIKITVEGPLMDGHKITFKAPCNCDVVEKLDVRYIENNTQKSKLFTMKDSHGKDLTGLGNLFFKDAYVDVVLDINTSSAYLQNASTNTYLEEKIKFTEAHTPVDNLESDRADLPLSARQGKILNESLGVIERGRTTIELKANGDKYTDVTFSKTFTTPPTVVVTISDQVETQGYWEYVIVGAVNITTTGFRINTHNVDSSAKTCYANWIAIGN